MAEDRPAPVRAEPRSKVWGRLFGWNREQTKSQLWGTTLPPGPLNAHLVSLHTILTYVGADGDALAVAEHHLREIAVFTQESFTSAPRRNGKAHRHG